MFLYKIQIPVFLLNSRPFKPACVTYESSVLCNTCIPQKMFEFPARRSPHVTPWRILIGSSDERFKRTRQSSKVCPFPIG